jgi:hypothetical protein
VRVSENPLASTPHQIQRLNSESDFLGMRAFLEPEFLLQANARVVRQDYSTDGRMHTAGFQGRQQVTVQRRSHLSRS